MNYATATGSSAVGLALFVLTCIEDAVAQEAAPPEIISFIASDTTVTKGKSVTLSWETANANTILLGRAGTEDFRSVPASGSQLVSPDKTTTYVLMAGHRTTGPTMESKTLQIQVTGTMPTADCLFRGG
jgi:hypothetical protein